MVRDLPHIRTVFFFVGVFLRNLSETAVEYGHLVLELETQLRVVVVSPVLRFGRVRRFQRYGFVTVFLRYLHPAIPAAMLDVAAPENDQSGREFLLVRDEGHCPTPRDFCAESVQIFSASH